MRKTIATALLIIVGAAASYYGFEILPGSSLIEECKKEVEKSTSGNGMTAFVHLVDCGAMDSLHSVVSLSPTETYDKSKAAVVAVFGSGKPPSIKWKQGELIVTSSLGTDRSYKVDNYKYVSITYVKSAAQ